MITTYIGMGSNLGDSQKILSEAIVQLQQLGTVRTSKLYQSPPMGPQDQPNYLNAVAELKTELDAHALLDELQRIEQESGRVRLRHWGERTLDLDLLIYGAEQIKTERLTVPHPGVMERDFVVIPLLDLDQSIQIQDQPLKTLAIVKNPVLDVLADENWAKI
ncbi:2-amino-4-hydroxy-6-hydroxymethyldihydropteridine diphosphokinase [Acinetobacter chinensis]|uniref:2-amino-4-hydroxy-6-hydroxymethyldihydropteridine pyrophosphokinase n=1 Tax=Acinetobacter chinensis TaxID=2004650 RepID=A0A3B7M531_9GAMM|nr:2-amino-4-hydroxy-6-hydroxymethyldihydropteridine diphosphokinase [Acinetobacter chinensis]AXY57773.1 2-amino-4-hydroxy-6-hydroxymethyldihydropteridine diphosphokinase [Acinetobacter chinensis]WOE41078.1 2-amino-4-hydroxy-6-hydroxymethyldihydropteridine diphosphokinase [Acinetobacter chinensis]